MLDVVDIPLAVHTPQACHTENWRVEAGARWTKIRQLGWTELNRYVEQPNTIWTNGYSTRRGSNDEIPLAVADQLPNSLCLIRVPNLELNVSAPGVAYGDNRRRVQADFRFSGHRYALWVTDPVVEDHYLALKNGSYALEDCCLCISLSEPHQKNGGAWSRYKLVAAVIPRRGCRP